MICRLRKAESRKVLHIGLASLQSSWYNAQPLSEAPREWLFGPLLREMFGARPREKVDDRISQILLLLIIPGQVEKVEGFSHAW